MCFVNANVSDTIGLQLQWPDVDSEAILNAASNGKTHSMQSSIFAHWARGALSESHLVLPAVIGLILLGMYFGGNPFLQNLIAPTMSNTPGFSAREFGVLEMLQNIFLLCVIYYAVRCVMTARDLEVKLFTLLILAASVFVLLEEIDYGAHFLEYFSGQYASLSPETWNRNWHNKTGPAGVQNVSYLKLAASIAVLAGFVVAPLLLHRNAHPTIRLLLPSRWMIATVMLIVLLSLLAHWLEDSGYAVIGSNAGNLQSNISEFRELNMYYLFLLYVAILHERIINRRGATSSDLLNRHQL